MISIKWIGKKEKKLDEREHSLKQRERELKLLYLDIVIKVKSNQIKRMDDPYF